MASRLIRTASILFVFIFSNTALAQQESTPFIIGEQTSIHSNLLDEDRSIIVWVPRNYALSVENYPVLYLLDGAPHFLTTTAIVNFLAANTMIPEMIVVAINNTDRNRDLTPPSQNEKEMRMAPTHGGADQFQAFIANELMPWVEEKYRTHPYKVLVGHSFGGLFAINTIFTNPELFDAYIVISPSLQWNDQYFAKQADDYFGAIDTLPISLYMTAGNEGNQLLGGVRKLAGVLDEKAPQAFKWSFKHLPIETHGSVPLMSTYEGLEFIFANWDLRNAFETYEKFGLEAIEKFYAEGDRRYKYNRGIPLHTYFYVLRDLIQNQLFEDAMTLTDNSTSTLNPPADMLVILANALRTNDRKTDAIKYYRATLRRNPGNQAARAALDDWSIDYSDLIPNVALTARVQERYIGQYDLQEAGAINVVLDNGTLFREYTGTRFALHPITDSQFYISESDLLYQFILTDDGQVTGLNIDQAGTPVYASRL